MINLTNKERMLLEDQKHHEEICIQKYTDYANQTQCSELKQIFNNNANQEREHLNTINQMLSGQIPDVINQQQQQGQQNQMNVMQNTAVQQNNNAMQANNGNVNNNENDAKLCSDLLMTEKYVSGTYDTSIFEFTNSDFREALNHIQKEEQQHGEAIFNYMQSKGMYNPQ